MKDMSFIPGSALSSENVVQKSEKMVWFKGETFVEALDKINIEEGKEDKPLRVTVDKVHKFGEIGTVLMGRLVSGILEPGKIVTFDHYLGKKPIFTQVESIEKFHRTVEQTLPGDCVGLNERDLNAKELKRGRVCEKQRGNLQKEHFFFTEGIIAHAANGINNRYMLSLQCNTATVTCRVVRILTRKQEN